MLKQKNLIKLLCSFQKMSSDSEDEAWHITYPKNTHLLLSPGGQEGVLIPMTTETRLPFSYRLQRIQKKISPPHPHPFLKKDAK
jgi:hypothetical protein